MPKLACSLFLAPLFFAACSAPPEPSTPAPTPHPAQGVAPTQANTTASDAAPDPNCGKEGETVETWPDRPDTRKCCPGLGEVIDGSMSDNGQCLIPPPVASRLAVCRKSCGDGKCASDENKCTCEADCK